MRNNRDTIAAIATPNGEGGIAIVRISGPNALPIAKRIFRPSQKSAAFEHGRMLYGYAVDADGSELDEVMAVYFQAPRSYTRQDVCEIHTHGGVSSALVLERAVKEGARPAERGEFTYRAFMNGRIDLSRAEAVMALVSASGEKSARASVRQLKNGASVRIEKCREKLKDIVTLIDAAADFPEEIDEDVTFERVRSLAGEVLQELQKLADKRYARIMNKGARAVIAGRPNVGKSSLMNALLAFERSIVTDIPGTTRDTVSESVSISGLEITLTDTAGIRDTSDPVEHIGVKRAEESIESADCVILVLDASEDLTDEDRKLLAQRDERYILVANKADVKREDFGMCLCVSARTGEGIGELSRRIYDMVSAGEDDEKLLTLRHVECAERAIKALERLMSAPEGTYLDLLRDDATQALLCRGEISGENVSESVIDGIFERFCVGK